MLAGGGGSNVNPGASASNGGRPPAGGQGSRGGIFGSRVNARVFTTVMTTAIAASLASSVVSSLSSSSSSASMASALGMVHHAQFLAIAGRVGKGTSPSARRKAKDSDSDSDSGSEESNASSEISEGLNWTNFHWIDLSEASQCLGPGNVDL
jgi:hypothetical protein